MSCKSCVFFGIDNYCNYHRVLMTDLSLCDDYEEKNHEHLYDFFPDCFCEGDLE